ncbi:FAD-dependent oxidoreductase [Kiritimatiella glycovorans]|uniref:Nitrite reductase [NAD(P)H] n=1 Tax=Kiritimatiella glycovorans TaxID=1307763 RepID=A0A0G3EH55_9BACT|nr:FAD-dependent oxidoreductase [Kiritimatiella glycovorans]AKJ63469.1 Nitrite reductase [NAD(P)H] [Kiritimatiella glycovorans]
MKWRCTVCGYVHEGDEPPEECPVCGAPAEQFEPLEEEAADRDAGQGGSAGRVVVIGAGVAGLTAAEMIRDRDPDAEITLLSDERELPYYRLNLTRFLAGDCPEENLPIHPAAWYDEKKIDLRLETRASELDAEKKEVRTEDGETFGWDRVILATGAAPAVPPVEGTGLDGIHTLRSADDARAIRAAVGEGLKCICVGGGILGLEIAGALNRQGADVTLLEMHDHLMPRQLNATAGDLMADFCRARGIDIRTGVSAKRFAGEGAVRGVELNSGEKLDTGLVLINIGIRSRTGLAAEQGMACGRGVTVDDRLRAGLDGVYAVGDACEHRGVKYEAWDPARYQGHIAGLNAAGVDTQFGGIPRQHVLKVLGCPMMSVGRFEAEEGDLVIEDGAERPYRRFVFRDRHLAGCVLLGDTALSENVREAIESGRDFGDLRGCSADDVADRL